MSKGKEEKRVGTEGRGLARMLRVSVFLFFCFSFFFSFFWSCGKDEGLVVNPKQLWGEWVQDSDTNYHWTFNEDWTGELVHTGSVAPGDDNNGAFTWKINGGDELEAEFTGSGELGGIVIVKLYTIKKITSTTLRWEDQYGRTTNYTKVKKESDK